MNVLLDKWIPCGDKKATISELLSGEISAQEVKFMSHEMDRFFKIFVHGIVQTVFCPSSKKEWVELYEMNPSKSELENKFKTFNHLKLFDLSYSNGGGFMQFDKTTNKTESFDSIEVKSLILDGVKTDAYSFEKSEPNVSRWFTLNRDDNRGVCKECASFFLWMYQTTAYKAGQGHYSSISGDKSAFSCYELKDTSDASFWNECVLNVVSFENGVNINDFSWLDFSSRHKDKGKTDAKRTKLGEKFDELNDVVYEVNPSPLKVKDFSSPVVPYLYAPRKVLFSEEDGMAGQCKCGLCGSNTTNGFNKIYRAGFGFQLGDIECIPPYSVKKFFTDKDDVLIKGLLKLRYSESLMFNLSNVFLSSIKLDKGQNYVLDARANEFDLAFIEDHELDDEFKMSIFGLDSGGSELTMFIDNEISYWNATEDDLEKFTALAKWANNTSFLAVKAICTASSTSQIGRKSPKDFDFLYKEFNRKSVSLASLFINNDGGISFDGNSLRLYSEELITFIRNASEKHINAYCSKYPMAAGKGYKALTDMLKRQKSSIIMNVMGAVEETKLKENEGDKEEVI